MDKKGFTLLEVILVISILGILLLVPSLKASSALSYRERKELSTFKKDIDYARNRAIVESCRYSVFLNFDKNYYIVKKHDRIEIVLKKYEFKSGLKLINTKNLGNQISFGYSGTPSKAGTVFLEDRKGKKIKITIVPVTGKVNIYIDD